MNYFHTDVVYHPNVQLVATSNPYLQVLSDHMELDKFSEYPEDTMEFAGRACYQSFDKPNPATRANKDYLANIIAQKHESVLEHSSFTFYITKVSRSFTHELIRHRHLSFSQQSQRYVDESDAYFVVPPAWELEEEDIAEKAIKRAFKTYKKLVKSLTKKGLSRKQAREAARAVLPNGVETRIVVTGNARTWREVITKRLNPHADKEFQEVAASIYKNLEKEIPSVVADLRPLYDGYMNDWKEIENTSEK